MKLIPLPDPRGRFLCFGLSILRIPSEGCSQQLNNIKEISFKATT